MLKAFSIDDLPIIRERLRKMMGSMGDIEIVGESPDYREYHSLIRSSRPGVIIADIKSADTQRKRRWPDAEVKTKR